MRGRDVFLIRERLGLSPGHFADLLGVVPSTVNRWEKSRTVNVEPLQRRLLALFAQVAEPARVGARARNAIDARGPLWGLYVALGDALSVPPKPSRVALLARCRTAAERRLVERALEAQASGGHVTAAGPFEARTARALGRRGVLVRTAERVFVEGVERVAYRIAADDGEGDSG